MIGIPDNRQRIPDAERARLTRAGNAYMQSGEYPLAYYCLKRSGRTDMSVLYNMALCCFHVRWHEECLSLLRDVERLLPVSTASLSGHLPPPLLRWEHEESPFLCPMPEDAPPETATIQVLRLKAESAAHLALANEVKAIASRLGGKYRHIQELTNDTFL